MNKIDFAEYIMSKEPNTIINFSFNEDLEGKYGCGIHELYDGVVFSIGYWGGENGLQVRDLCGAFIKNGNIYFDDKEEVLCEIEYAIKEIMDFNDAYEIYLETDLPTEYKVDIKYI